MSVGQSDIGGKGLGRNLAVQVDEGKLGRGLGSRTALDLRKRRLWDDPAAPGRRDFLEAFLWLPVYLVCICTHYRFRVYSVYIFTHYRFPVYLVCIFSYPEESGPWRLGRLGLASYYPRPPGKKVSSPPWSLHLQSRLDINIRRVLNYYSQ